MTTLFQRAWKFSIGSLDVSELDGEFTIRKTIRREPNTCTLTIYNLSENSRGSLDGDSVVQVRAGYETQSPIPVLFTGGIRKIQHAADGVDIATTVEARDAGRQYQTARVSRSYGPGTPVSRVLLDTVDAMGIGPGNVATQTIRLSGGATDFADGFVAHGSAVRVVDSILRGAGYRWSVQNGALQVLQRGRALASRAVVLSADTGLLGSPSQGDKGIVTAVCLLQPGLDPGRRVSLQSQTITGTYEIRAVEYAGSTFADSWDATLELRPT